MSAEEKDERGQADELVGSLFQQGGAKERSHRAAQKRTAIPESMNGDWSFAPSQHFCRDGRDNAMHHAESGSEEELRTGLFGDEARCREKASEAKAALLEDPAASIFCPGHRVCTRAQAERNAGTAGARGGPL